MFSHTGLTACSMLTRVLVCPHLLHSGLACHVVSVTLILANFQSHLSPPSPAPQACSPGAALNTWLPAFHTHLIPRLCPILRGRGDPDCPCTSDTSGVTLFPLLSLPRLGKTHTQSQLFSLQPTHMAPPLGSPPRTSLLHPFSEKAGLFAWGPTVVTELANFMNRSCSFQRRGRRPREPKDGRGRGRPGSGEGRAVCALGPPLLERERGHQSFETDCGTRPFAQGSRVGGSHTEAQGVRLPRCHLPAGAAAPPAWPGADCVIGLSWQSGRCHKDARLHSLPVPGSVAFSTRASTGGGGTDKGKQQLRPAPGQGTAPVRRRHLGPSLPNEGPAPQTGGMCCQSPH